MIKIATKTINALSTPRDGSDVSHAEEVIKQRLSSAYILVVGPVKEKICVSIPSCSLFSLKGLVFWRVVACRLLLGPVSLVI